MPGPARKLLHAQTRTSARNNKHGLNVEQLQKDLTEALSEMRVKVAQQNAARDKERKGHGPKERREARTPEAKAGRKGNGAPP